MRFDDSMIKGIHRIFIWFDGRRPLPPTKDRKLSSQGRRRKKKQEKWRLIVPFVNVGVDFLAENDSSNKPSEIIYIKKKY